MNNHESIQMVEGSPRVSVAVTFLSSEQGGRSQKANDSPRYRPHLVVGNPEQRVPLTDGSGTGIEDYIGVQFTGDGRELPTDIEVTVSLALIYHPRVDYSALSAGATFTVREGGRVIGFGRVLQGSARAVSPEGLEVVDGEIAMSLPCRCVTLANVAVVEMGSPGDEALGTIEERRSRGEPWWWLWCGECSGCGQWWLVGQEERQNDVFCLRRLDADETNDLMQNDVWPSDFDQYESLLRLGHDAGVMFRFADPEEASSLRWTIADLAKARPGIRVAELAFLLNLELDTAHMLAERAIREDGVVIQLD